MKKIKIKYVKVKIRLQKNVEGKVSEEAHLELYDPHFYQMIQTVKM